MTLFGITGGVGMGKSASSRFLQEWNVEVVDTDLLARQLVEPSQPALTEIAQQFGPRMVGDDGQLNRGALAEVVFASSEKRAALEAILHPRIRQAWKSQVEIWRKAGRRQAAVIIPLLFETGAAGEFDRILCLACRPETQRRRLAERGWNAQQIDQRLASQMPIESKMDKSHRVIWTEPSLEVHAAQLARAIAD